MPRDVIKAIIPRIKVLCALRAAPPFSKLNAEDAEGLSISAEKPLVLKSTFIFLSRLIYYVGVGLEQKCNCVYKPANAEKSTRKEVENTSSDFTLVKLVRADVSEE